jgi:hypothetical protein
MLSEVYLAVVLVISGTALLWNQYEYLRVVRSKTGEAYPVVGSGITSYIARPWRLLTGFDQLVRVGSARQADPVVEAARQQFLRRRHLVMLGFLVAAALGMLLIPNSA